VTRIENKNILIIVKTNNKISVDIITLLYLFIIIEHGEVSSSFSHANVFLPYKGSINRSLSRIGYIISPHDVRINFPAPRMWSSAI